MVLKAATARNQTTIHFSSGRPSTQLAGDACDEIGDFDDEPTYDAPSLVPGKRARHESGCGSDRALEITGNALTPPV